MSLLDVFTRKNKKFIEVVDEAEASEEFTPDCPAIIELKHDNELGKELNLQIDENYYTLDDLLTVLKLSKAKPTKCNITVNKIDDSTIHFIFNEGKVILKSDFTFDWEV
jgi:hypothetical protein|tara:strand:- start:7588 stop:7914 length:327 start_codon:yes stop_codon:yes gene_type:complete